MFNKLWLSITLRLFVLFVVVFLAEHSIGEVRYSGQKSLKNYLSWSEEVGLNGIDCLELDEVSAVLVCFGDPQFLSPAIRRVEVYSCDKKGIGRNKIVSRQNPAFKKIEFSFSGLAIDGDSVLKFYAEANRLCAKNKNLCLNQSEEDFYTNAVEPFAKKFSTFAILGIARRDSLGHELLHAQFYTNPRFRSTIVQFWNLAMLKEERDRVRAELSSTPNYNGKEEIQIIDEFQAYILSDFGGMKFTIDQQSQGLKRRLIEFLNSRSIEFTNGDLRAQYERAGSVFNR